MNFSSRITPHEMNNLQRIALTFMAALLIVGPTAELTWGEENTEKPLESQAVVYAVKPSEQRAPYQYASGFGIPRNKISHLVDNSSLAGVGHVVINMHGSSQKDGEPIVKGYDKSGKSLGHFTAAALAQRLRDRGFQGNKVTLAICYSGSEIVKNRSYAQALADTLGIQVVGYDHFVGTPDVFSHPVTKAVVNSWEIVLFKLPGKPQTFVPTLNSEAEDNDPVNTPSPTPNPSPAPTPGPSPTPTPTPSPQLPPIHIHRPPGWGLK